MNRLKLAKFLFWLFLVLALVFGILLISTNPKEMPDFEITDRYAQLLEEQIREEPELWLWTHNRWKRTKEEWLKHQEKKEANS